MAEMLASSGPVLCAAVFFLGFVVVSVIESYRPRARLVAPLGRRWIANIGLYLLYFVLFAAAGDVPYTFVFWGESYGIAALAGLHPGLAVVLGIVAADVVRYWSHRLHHAVPFLWRLHEIHHTDRDLDVTTTMRHHPLEGASMWLVTAAAYTLLGVPLLAIVLYEVIATALSTIQHANLRVPPALETALARVLVTPDTHRIHHSLRPDEGNANFGIVSSIWDRLFGTHVALDAQAHERLAFGVAGAHATEDRLPLILLAPFLPSTRRANLPT